MDTLVSTLLAELSHNLDRLAEELEPARPRIATSLRAEAARTGALVAGESRRPPRRRALRPLLYCALDEGAVEAAQFDRLMTLTARARRP